MIATVIARADGGCSACVSGLTGLMAKAFPQFAWSYVDSWGAEDCDVHVNEADDILAILEED